jgi:hypothetical protein
MKPFLGRFSEEFGPDEEEEGRPMRANGEPYPEDFTFTFTGNTDDNFSIGLKFTRKSAKLFSKLQFSDIVIASPLAVRMLVGEHGKGADCLSSIEIAVLVGMELLHMQNWEHLLTTMEAMNQTPGSDHGADFSRVRPFCLNGKHVTPSTCTCHLHGGNSQSVTAPKAKLHGLASFVRSFVRLIFVCLLDARSGWGRSFRQTILLGPYATPDANALFRQECNSLQGRVRVQESSNEGVVQGIAPKVRQLFQRIPREYTDGAAAMAKQEGREPDPDEERFAYFTVRLLLLLHVWLLLSVCWR